MDFKQIRNTPWMAFCSGSFPLPTHIGLAVTWMIGLYGSLYGINQQTWQLNGTFFGGLLSLFLMLFFLRGVDEIKDLPYDTQYNPDRPLVTGIVTISRIVRYLIITGAILIIVNSFISLRTAIMVTGILTYSLFLLVLEKKWQGFSDHLIINALFSHPLHIAKNIYILMLFYGFYPVIGIKEILLIISYSLGFFHFEFTRKAVWPENISPGERSYATYLGGWGLVFAMFLTGFSAMVIQTGLFQPWHEAGLKCLAGGLPVVCMIVGGMHIVYFIKHRKESAPMKAKASFYYGVFHQVLAFYGILASSPVQSLLK